MLCRPFALILSLLIFLSATPLRAADIRIKTYQGTSSSSTTSTLIPSTDTSITINVDYQISRICIFTDGGGHAGNIKPVQINHTGATARSSELKVILMDRSADQAFPAYTTNLDPVATNCEGISFDSGTATWSTVSGSIYGNWSGALSAHKIVRLEVGGALSAAVTSATEIQWIEVGSSTTDGVITASSGDIDILKSTTGNLAGAISASGTILNIAAVGNISGAVTAVTLGDESAPGAAHAITAAGVTGALHFTGNVEGNIVVDHFSGSGALTVDGDLVASIHAAGDITSVTVGGGIFGPNGAGPIQIVSDSGSIGSIDVGGYIIDDSEGAVVINAPGGIGSISCYRLSFANIGPQTFGTGHPGIALGSLTVSVDVVSSILHLSTVEHIDIHGSVLSENVHSLYPSRIVTDVLPSTSTIRIGGGLDFYTSIETEQVDSSPHHAGQTILNANAGSAAVDYLQGEVDVWSDALFQITDPHYTDQSSLLGGGAVGVVPYPFYPSDCAPAIPSDNASDNPLVIARSAFTTSVGLDLAFKGPVFTSGGYVPFAIYRSLPSDIADATCRFTQTISGRVVSIRATDSNGPPAGIYHITSERNLYAILCNDVLANPMLFCDGLFPGADLTTVESVDIWISIPEVDSYTCDGHGDCVADYDDGSGTNHPDSAVTIDDLLFYLTIFMDGALCADIDDGSGDGVPDSGVTIDDLLYYLTRFVNGC